MRNIVDIMKAMAAVACFIAAFPALATAQERTRVDMGRPVGTTDPDKKAVQDVWRSYLDSRPDLMWSDGTWNDQKNRFWLDFDLTAPFVYQLDGGSFDETYRPAVMAVQKEGELYSIRTVFDAETPDSVDGDRIPWAIVRVYAQKVAGEWKLRSALGVLTADWNRPAIGKITFVSPPSRGFNTRLARRAVAFCDSVSEAFPFLEWDPFYFYITDRPEDVDRILGLEYYRDGFPEGRAMRSHDILITGAGSEWYPHGLTRMMAAGPGLPPHEIIADGFVGWIGGWYGRTYEDNMREIAAQISANDEISFEEYIDRRSNEAISRATYFPGAVACDMVYAAAGAPGIEALFKAGPGDQDLYRAIQSTTGLDRNEFEQAWRRRVLAFRD